MLRLTRKTDYALVALARLAGADRGSPVSARRIAEEYRLPLPLMMNLLKNLQQAGFVRSARGARGGYYLADRPEQIRLVSVIEAIEGPLQLTVCCEDEPEDAPCLSCALTPRCPITMAMRHVNARIANFLSPISLRDLMESTIHVPAADLGVGTAPLPSSLFAPKGSS